MLTFMRVTNPPSVCGHCAALPRYRVAGHRWGWPRRHQRQCPHECAGYTATGVPAAGPVPSPAAVCTVPTISCPRIMGALSTDAPAAPSRQ